MFVLLQHLPVTAEVRCRVEGGSLTTEGQLDRSAQILTVFDADILAGGGEVFGERLYTLELWRR